MIETIDIFRLYNLYNEEAYFLDFRKESDFTINLTQTTSITSYQEYMSQYTPDNFNYLIIIGDLQLKNKIDKIISKIRGFKNFYFFEEDDMNQLYHTFPILFNNSTRFYPSIITFLFPKMLFLGSIKTITSDFLETNRIEKIINMTYNTTHLENEIHIPIQDSEYTDINNILDETFDIIEQYQNILVVCEKGQSRSVAVVLFYYIKKYGIDFNTALNNLRLCRTISNPNYGFIKQIIDKLNLT